MSLTCSAWITRNDMADCGCPDDAPAAIVNTVITAASDVMYQLTGHMFPGECEEQIYPQPISRGYWLTRFDSDPVWTPLGETWPTVSTDCLATNGCCCDGVPTVRFDRDRIIEVTEVVIGTTTLAASAYRLDIDRRGYALTRIDGNSWPCRQATDDSLPNDDSWSVTYTYGESPPDHVKWATALYAAELVKLCVGDDTCQLPSNVTQVTTEGLQYVLEVTTSSGRTGIRVVDDIISAVNPGGVFRRARFVSPESVDNRRVIPAGS